LHNSGKSRAIGKENWELAAMSRTTGQVCSVSGVYRAIGNCGHSVERVIPEGQVFPPCEYCREQGNRKDITWVLVVETQAK
jgi:hypothetical protein